MWLLIAMALAGTVHAQADAQPAILSDEQRTHIRTESFGPVTSVGAMPAGVRDQLKDLFGGGGVLELAEPGAPFQAGDVVTMPRLPFRRLIAAGCSSDHCLVYYEKGGFAHVYYAIVFTSSGSRAGFEFGGSAPGGLATVDHVRDAVTTGQVRGQARSSRYW